MDIELGIQNVARTVTFSTEESAEAVNTAIADAVRALEPAAALYSVVNATNHASVGLHLVVGFERLARLEGFGAVTFEGGQGVLLRRTG